MKNVPERPPVEIMVCANVELHLEEEELYRLGGIDYFVLHLKANGVEYNEPTPDFVALIKGNRRLKVGFGLCEECSYISDAVEDIVVRSQR